MDDNYKHPTDEKKVKFRLVILDSKNGNNSWVFIITIISFFLSASMSFISSGILENSSLIIAFVVVLVIIFIGIIFDIIGIAVTAADEAPFHAMASRKLYGAKQSIKLIRNANKVSSFCNDVVGDISGVISGAASAFIIVKIAGSGNTTEATIAGLIISGLVAAITVGGKALGKTIAIQNSSFIVYKVGVILKFVTVRLNFLNNKESEKKTKK